jgi:hypothetical protein
MNEEKKDKIEITSEDLENLDEEEKKVLDIEIEDLKEDAPTLEITLDDLETIEEEREFPPVGDYRPEPIRKQKQDRKKEKFIFSQAILYNTFGGIIAGVVAFLINEVLNPHKAEVLSADIIKLMVQSSIYFAITGGVLGSVLGSIEGIMIKVPEKIKRESIFCLIVGCIGGILGGALAQLIYGYYIINYSLSNISLILLRGVGWSIVGLSIGISQGMLAPSSKKMRNVVIGGALGGLIGGFLFQIIKDNVQSVILSRLLSLIIVSSAIGFFISLAEEIAKEAWLKVIKGALSGKEFIIYERETIIGSSPTCNIVLFKDSSVSPQHSIIKNENNRYIISDMHSKNGTYVNDERISDKVLQDGDIITIGNTIFRFNEKEIS